MYLLPIRIFAAFADFSLRLSRPVRDRYALLNVTDRYSISCLSFIQKGSLSVIMKLFEASDMKDRYFCRLYIALFFSLFPLAGCGGENESAFETAKTGDGKIETANPEGSTARKLHPRDFELEENWIETTCSVYEGEDLPLPGEKLNENFLLDGNSVWNCVRETRSFQIETEIRFHDDGTYSNSLTGWWVFIADAPVSFPPDKGCHRRGMPYNSTWEKEDPGFAFDRMGQWKGQWRVYGGRLYLKEEGLPGRLKSYAFSFNEEIYYEGEKEETILRLDDMAETYSDGSGINYQEDFDPSELDSEEIRRKREEQRRKYEQTEEFRNCQANSAEFGGCWTNPQLWKSDLRDDGTFCRIMR